MGEDIGDDIGDEVLFDFEKKSWRVFTLLLFILLCEGIVIGSDVAHGDTLVGVLKCNDSLLGKCSSGEEGDTGIDGTESILEGCIVCNGSKVGKTGEDGILYVLWILTELDELRKVGEVDELRKAVDVDELRNVGDEDELRVDEVDELRNVEVEELRNVEVDELRKVGELDKRVLGKLGEVFKVGEFWNDGLAGEVGGVELFEELGEVGEIGCDFTTFVFAFICVFKLI